MSCVKKVQDNKFSIVRNVFFGFPPSNFQNIRFTTDGSVINEYNDIMIKSFVFCPTDTYITDYTVAISSKMLMHSSVKTSKPRVYDDYLDFLISVQPPKNVNMNILEDMGKIIYNKLSFQLAELGIEKELYDSVEKNFCSIVNYRESTSTGIECKRLSVNISFAEGSIIEYEGEIKDYKWIIGKRLDANIYINPVIITDRKTHVDLMFIAKGIEVIKIMSDDDEDE